MLYGIYLSTAGAMVEEARQDVIANNLANASTHGFKADTPVFRARLAEALEKPLAAKNARQPFLDRVGGGVQLDEVSYTRQNGSLEASSNALDLALQGEGFFRVSDGANEYYTRNGSFQRSPSGYLTTADGAMKVLNESGQPIQLPLGEVRVGERGDITVDGTRVGRLGLSGATNPRHFEKVGATLYRYIQDGKPSSAEPMVRQSYLERSTVSPIHEMVRLIQSQRAYETNMQMIRLQDSTLERAVNGIAKVTA